MREVLYERGVVIQTKSLRLAVRFSHPAADMRKHLYLAAKVTGGVFYVEKFNHFCKKLERY